MIDIQSNAAVVASTLATAAQKVQRGLDSGLRLLEEEAEQRIEREVQKIEDAPIPTSPTGRPLWEHTGALLDGVGKATSIVMIGGGAQAEIGIGGDAAAYATRRHQLGAGEGDYAWTPANPAGGIVRRNEFMRDAEPEVQQLAEPTITAALKKELSDAI